MNLLKKVSLISILLLLLTGIFIPGVGCTDDEDINMPIVLLTDYGSNDYRIPWLKGIIYTNNPDAEVIDATHGVTAFDIHAGAFILNIAAREFPEDVVFVCIIAPYDQTEIKYLVLTTQKNQIFVLPDNGLLTYVVDDMGMDSIYQINNQDLFDKPIADLEAEPIQGKLGALIASGYSPEDVGIPLAGPTTLDIQKPEIDDGKLLGTVVYVDNYGNCVTNISGETTGEFGVNKGDTILVKIPDSTITATFGTIYSDVPLGDEIVFVKTNLDMLQLSLNLGDFAGKYNISAGTKIEIVK